MILDIDLTDVDAHALFNDDLTSSDRYPARQDRIRKSFHPYAPSSTNVYSNVHDLYQELNNLFGSEAEMTTSGKFSDTR